MDKLTVQRDRNNGFTLIEIMVAMALGLLLTGSLLSVFLTSNQNYKINERIARMQSSGRTALYLLADELRHINFWGNLVDISAAEAVPADLFSGQCAAWAGSAALGDQRLVASSDPANDSLFSGCIDTSSLQPDSGAFAIKRVNTGAADFAALTSGQIFLRAHSEIAMVRIKGVGDGALPPPTGWFDWIYQPKVFYVRNYWQTVGDGTPTLCAVQTVETAATTLVENCLIEGVEALHVEFGIDTSNPGDAVPDIYTADPTAAESANAVAVKLYVLVRDTDPDPRYDNSSTYQLGGRSITVSDHYRRALFSINLIANNQRNLPIR